MVRRDRTGAPVPKVHWVLLLIAVLLVGGGLGIDVIILSRLGVIDYGRDPAPADAVPAELRTGGPVIDARGGQPRSIGMQDKTIALTFDDGPDPLWTPRVLDVLRRHGVPATFFVTGANAARHPLLLRQLAAEGHELGNHSTTHADLGSISEGWASWEIRQAQVVLAGGVGQQTALLRLPYSSTAEALHDVSWQGVRRAGALGYLVVLATLDPKDWERPGVDAIIAGSTPTDQRGAIVLLHDSGGERAQTVAAVDRLIPRLKADGWRFTTVSQGLGIAGGNAPANLQQRLLGWVSIGAALFSRWLAVALLWVLSIATVLTLVRAVVVLFTAVVQTRRSRRRPALVLDGRAPPVTVVVPAFNEQDSIANTVRSILASAYPALHVIVVDDGSTDGTAAVVAALHHPRVTLIRQPNGGKAAALNTGIAAARTELVVLVDGDTVFEPGTVTELVAPLADPTVGAVAGNAKVGNRFGLLGRWQHIEYVIGSNLDRRMFDILGCMPTVPGAAGAFRRQAIVAGGGVPTDTLAEDTDLTMALLRANWRVVYAERARAWTEVPTRLGPLWKQRYRWSYGTLQAMWKHRRSIIERGRGGRLGRIGLPYLLVFQVLLPMLAPAVDVAGVYLLLVNPGMGGLIWGGFLLVQFIPAVVAFRLDGEPLGSLWSLPFQQILYRQLMYLVLVQSIVTAVVGALLPWHKLHHAGHAAVRPA